MKIIGLIIVISIGIVAYMFLNPDQSDNLRAVKEAIGIDENNPYAAKIRKIGEKQQAITKELSSGSDSLDGARIPDKLIANQEKIIGELDDFIEGLRKDAEGSHTRRKGEILLDIEESGVIDSMHGIQSQLRKEKWARAASISKECANQLEAWAKELEGSN